MPPLVHQITLEVWSNVLYTLAGPAEYGTSKNYNPCPSNTMCKRDDMERIRRFLIPLNKDSKNITDAVFEFYCPD